MIKFYGYKKCSTSRKSEGFLQNRKVDYTFVDITENPPSAPALKKIAKQAGIPAKKMFNTSGGAYKEGNYKERISSMSDDEIFDELAANGRLIKRPVVTDGSHSSVGYDEEKLGAF